MKRLVTRFLSYSAIERLRTMAYVIFYWSGLAWLFSLRAERGAKILLYHSIGGEGVFHDNIVSAHSFRRQIAFLASRYEIVPLARVIEARKRGDPISSRWVVLTFDDAYRDFIDTALPILEEFDALAALFVPETVLDGHVLFPDEIEHLLQLTKNTAFSVDSPRGPLAVHLGSSRQRSDECLRLVLTTREWDERGRAELLLNLRAAADVPGDGPRNVYVTRADVAALPDWVEVGSHTVTHPNLAAEDADRQEWELRESRQRLREARGRDVTSLAYPFGKPWSVGRETERLAGEAGYGCALTTRFGFVTHDDDLHSLPRIGVREGLVQLRVSLMGTSL